MSQAIKSVLVTSKSESSPVMDESVMSSSIIQEPDKSTTVIKYVRTTSEPIDLTSIFPVSDKSFSLISLPVKSRVVPQSIKFFPITSEFAESVSFNA